MKVQYEVKEDSTTFVKHVLIDHNNIEGDGDDDDDDVYESDMCNQNIA